jgi:DNA-directed RNA polymerase subunit H (RpoH/RPB5)
MSAIDPELWTTPACLDKLRQRATFSCSATPLQLLFQAQLFLDELLEARGYKLRPRPLSWSAFRAAAEDRSGVTLRPKLNMVVSRPSSVPKGAYPGPSRVAIYWPPDTTLRSIETVIFAFQELQREFWQEKDPTSDQDESMTIGAGSVLSGGLDAAADARSSSAGSHITDGTSREGPLDPRKRRDAFVYDMDFGLIIVVEKDLTPYSRGIVNAAEAMGLTVDVLPQEILMYNPENHNTVPRHRVLTPQEWTTVARRLHLTREGLPRLPLAKSIARWRGFPKDCVVEIKRPAKTSALAYRIVA